MVAVGCGAQWAGWMVQLAVLVVGVVLVPGVVAGLDPHYGMCGTDGLASSGGMWAFDHVRGKTKWDGPVSSVCTEAFACIWWWHRSLRS